jgi:hypothetical protein
MKVARHWRTWAVFCKRTQQTEQQQQQGGDQVLVVVHPWELHWQAQLAAGIPCLSIGRQQQEQQQQQEQ